MVSVAMVALLDLGEDTDTGSSLCDMAQTNSLNHPESCRICSGKTNARSQVSYRQSMNPSFRRTHISCLLRQSLLFCLFRHLPIIHIPPPSPNFRPYPLPAKFCTTIPEPPSVHCQVP